MYAGNQVQGRVLSAFAAWLRLSAGAGLDGPALASHPLTKAAMEGLKSLDTFEDASEAVCELVMCTASRGQPEPQMMPLVALLVPAVSARTTSEAFLTGSNTRVLLTVPVHSIPQRAVSSSLCMC